MAVERANVFAATRRMCNLVTSQRSQSLKLGNLRTSPISQEGLPHDTALKPNQKMLIYCV